MRKYSAFTYSIIIGCYSLFLSGCSGDLACWPICGSETSSGVASSSSSTTTSSTTETVTVLTPNSGETWEADTETKESISWSKSAGVSAVKVELYKSGVLQEVIRDSDSDEGAYYIIPAYITTGTDYKIKITSTSDPTVYDFSDASFRILSQTDTDG